MLPRLNHTNQLHWDKSWLEQEYVKNKRNTKEMAKIAKVTSNAIINAMVYYGIDRRTSKESYMLLRGK